MRIRLLRNALWLVLSACSQAEALEKGEIMLRLSSTAFEDGHDIPARYTCDGDDISPPLSWEGIPAQTQSFVLIVDDPDAPDPAAPKRTWVHWILFNLPPTVASLPEGASTLPRAVGHGLNDWKRTGYGGPCPPIGKHRYFHKLYALDTLLALSSPTKAEVEEAMQDHILARAQLIGTYQKQKR